MPESASRLWIACRRPLFLAFVLGCVGSLLVSGMLTLRLVVPVTIYWAYVPVAEVAALAVVTWRRRGSGGGRAPLAAIGSSDYHGIGLMGYARTFVFVRGRTEQGVIEAVRAHRTIVFDGSQVYGDPALIDLASQAGLNQPGFPVLPVPGVWRLFSRLAGVLVLVGLVLTRR